MSLKNKLNRFKSHLVSSKEVSKHQPLDDDIPYLDKWIEEGANPYFFDNQYCFIRKKSYPLHTMHGCYKFVDFIKAVELWNESTFEHPLSTKGYRPDQLFFFDTETTGLNGGSGNSIFILGHASINEQEVCLTQHILPHPGAEIPLYQSFLSQIDYKTLVTYNGKSFDWPQVKTQHTLIRDHLPKLPDFGHFDLYHAAKRLWKHKLERMKLAIVEEEILKIKREDDVPGFLAPMIYYDFIDRKDPEGMFKLIKHNEIDILSLIILYTHLSFQLLGVDQNQSFKERYETGRWFSSLGEGKQAEALYSQIAKNSQDEVSDLSQLQLGYLYKKQHKFELSVECLIQVSNSNNPDLQIEACIEIAKILEHRNKEYSLALFYTEKAMRLLEKGIFHKRVVIEDVYKRINRLKKKEISSGKSSV